MPPDPPRGSGPSALQYIGLPAYSTTRTPLLQNLMKPLYYTSEMKQFKRSVSKVNEY